MTGDDVAGLTEAELMNYVFDHYCHLFDERECHVFWWISLSQVPRRGQLVPLAPKAHTHSKGRCHWMLPAPPTSEDECRPECFGFHGSEADFQPYFADPAKGLQDAARAAAWMAEAVAL